MGFLGSKDEGVAVPKSWKSAAPLLRWQVQRRGWVELASLAARASGVSASTASLVHDTLGEQTVLALVVEVRDQVVGVTEADLAGWGVTRDRAATTARLNLGERIDWKSSGAATSPVTVLSAEDDFAAARFLIDPHGAGIPFIASPVAFVVDQHTVVVLPAAHREALAGPTFSLAVTLMESTPRPLLAEPLVFDGKSWAPAPTSTIPPAAAVERKALLTRSWKQKRAGFG